MAMTLNIDVTDDEIAREVAFGILGRANDIHQNPDDDFEDVAIELRDIGQTLLNEYE